MKKALIPLAAACACAAFAQAARAQAPDAAAGASESIVIEGQYMSTGAQSAMKLDVPVRDTPFSVSSYTDAFMKAIEVVKVDDMYSYMTGVKKAGNTGYDISLRGFKTSNSDRNAILVDGLPGLTGRFSSPPTVAMDHIELVKGPMSVLYGQAQPGGFINLVTKKPQATPSNMLDVRLTSYEGGGVHLGDRNGMDVAIDSTGPIDADKKFLYRLIAQGADRDLWRGTNEKPVMFAPSIAWNISDRTLATVQFDARQVKASYDLFLVTPNRSAATVAAPRTRYQEPGDWQKEAGKTLSLSLEHTFANDIRWVIATRHVRNHDDTHGWDNAAIRTPTTLQRRARQQHNERKFDFGDTSLTVPFATGPVTHKLIFGLNGGREINDFERIQFFNAPALYDINIYNPVYGAVPPIETLAAGTVNRRYTNSRSVGVYASDLVTLSEHWKLNLGVRRTRDMTGIKELKLPNVADQNKIAQKTLPLVGLLYQPNKTWTYYTSYSTSYVPAPATAQDTTGKNPFRPELGKQIEVGAKAENLLNGKLNGTFALYKIDKTDALVTSPCPLGTCTQQIGAEQSRGVEVELNAQPLPNWQLTAGYAYNEAQVKASNDPAQVGATLTAAAKNTANIWSRYDIDSGALKGLGIGLGATYVGPRPGLLPVTGRVGTLDIDSYTVVDLALSYTVGRFDFNLKVGNLLDRQYLEAPGFSGDLQITPGTPRNLALSMRTRF